MTFSVSVPSTALAARLAGVEQPRAAEIADALAQESIITATRPIEFVHPLVRTAVYADGSDMRRSGTIGRCAAATP